MRGASKVILVICSLAFLTFVIFSRCAIADPIAGVPKSPFAGDTTLRLEDPFVGIAVLSLLNIFVNLLLVAGFLFLLGRRLRDRIGRVPRKGWVFLVSILALAAVITIVGAVVDYYLVMGIDPSYDSQARVIIINLEYWTLALVIISISVVLSSYTLLRLEPAPGAVLGILFIPINLVWWILSGHYGLDVGFVTILASVIALPAVIGGLLTFHQEMLSGRRFARAEEHHPPVESTVIRR